MILCSLYHYFLITQHQAKQERFKNILINEKNNNNNNNSEAEKKNYMNKEQIKLDDQITTKSVMPPKYTISQQFILSFSAIKNTEKLLFVQNRYSVIDTIR